MKNITKEMCKDFKLQKLGYDFMGYKFKNKEELSFHHLIVPHRYCKEQGLGEGYLYWNGAILRQNTSHDYLHLIESKDLEIFNLITSEMIDENIKGYLDLENIRYIDDLLEYFEKEHDHDKSKNKKYLIKEEYKSGRIKL